MANGLQYREPAFKRRAFLQLGAVVVGFAAGAGGSLFNALARAQSGDAGLPQPDEAVADTLKRLFGGRKLLPGEGKIKLDLPLIAEDGGSVSVAVEANVPVAGATHLEHIYILSDKNRRPLLAKFSFSADSGRASVATSVRLATTTDVRAIAEMNDGSLYAVARNVRVTISGCDLPPQS